MNEGPGKRQTKPTGDISVLTSSVWNVNGDANWDDSSSWHGGVPNAIDAEADLFNAITASHSVNMGSAVIAGVLGSTAP